MVLRRQCDWPPIASKSIFTTISVFLWSLARMPESRRLGIEQLESRRLLAFNPSGAEQEFLQMTNRFRTDPAGEFTRLISSASPIRARDATLQNDLDAFGVDGNLLRSEIQSLTPVAPVAWNDAISEFAAEHNGKMLSANPPSHFHSNTTQRREALLAAGVNLRFVAGEKINSENVFGYAKSLNHLHASYVIDWGQGTGGMQTGRRHRTALMNPDYEQFGTSLANYTGSDNFGPLVNTQILANIQDPPVMVIGAVFEDKNDSSWYEAGEGIGSVQLAFEGTAGRFTTTGRSAGGYQIELPPGTYRATASGGTMAHAVVVSSITVGSSNVWQNFIYDPDSIPPDDLEPNNSLPTATQLSGTDQTITGTSIHTTADKDYFRLESQGSTTGTFEIRFNHSSGNLDLRLLDYAGGVIASSSTSGNSETITATLERHGTYFLEVASAGSAKNGAYTLVVNPPKPAPPTAGNDRSDANNAARSATINVLANDNDPDGEDASLVVQLAANSDPAFTVNGQAVSYTAPPGYSGVHRTTYTITDDQGLTSAPARIEVFVVDFSMAFPWLNTALPTDINADGITTPSDALLVINDLNSRSSRRLPTSPDNSAGIFGFYDSSGDGFVAPIDVLLIVNRLNSGSGEGEPEPQPQRQIPHDKALLELLAAESLQIFEQAQKRDDWTRLPSFR